MKIYKIAIIDVHEEEGHISIPQMKDFVQGFIKGFSAIEIQRHMNQCPICENNYLELKNRGKKKNNESFLDGMNFLDEDPRD